ncbi:MAG: 16S rRNA processing protein RimM [Myxococcota bacterium]|jgi:16S rRNA processing protein RimM
MATVTGPKSKTLPGVREDELHYGRINGVFGIQGEVRLFLYNRESDLLAENPEVTLLHEGKRWMARIKSRSGAGKRVLGRVSGVTTPEAARALIGTEILIPTASLPSLPEGTYYHHQLLGLSVHTESGELLGTIKEIHTSGDVDLWLVHSRDAEIYIPAVGEEIISVQPGVGVVVSDG